MTTEERIACVVPTVRPELMADFVESWKPLFERHSVTLVTVWDGEYPSVSTRVFSPTETHAESAKVPGHFYLHGNEDHDLFCRHTDAVRNYGFLYCAYMQHFTRVLTTDDDVRPLNQEPIARHLVTLSRRVPVSWMNTADDYRPVGDSVVPPPTLYLRGFPDSIRGEAPVMLSHGVWTGVPDFDGETQLRLEKTTGIPPALPYHVGPVPRGVLFPLCGMNVMIRAEALPYFYFAPMGRDSGYPEMHRFADIFMGISLKQEFDRLGWACYTGASVVSHSRASSAEKNFAQEKLGRELLDQWAVGDYSHPYHASYTKKMWRYHDLIRSYAKGTSRVEEPPKVESEEESAVPGGDR